MNTTAKLLVRMSDPQGGKLATETGAIDWTEFDRLALMHGTYPCIYRANLQSPILPTDLAEKARMETEGTLARAYFFSHVASRTITTLRENGVESLLLKGPALAFGVYPSPELRPFSDIDLFIHERDNRKVLEILANHGLSLNKPQLQEFNLREKSQLKFEDHVNQPTIEVHWDFVNSHSLQTSLALDEDKIWSTRENLRIGELTLPILSPEMTFVEVSIHQAYQHQFDRFLWLIDLLQIIRRYGSKEFWESVEEITRGSGGARTAVHCALKRVLHFFPGCLSRDLPSRFRPQSLKAKILMNSLAPESVFAKAGTVLTFRRKAFRQALKY